MKKKCSKCERELSFLFFGIDNRAKDKKRSECISCGLDTSIRYYTKKKVEVDRSISLRRGLINERKK